MCGTLLHSGSLCGYKKYRIQISCLGSIRTVVSNSKSQVHDWLLHVHIQILAHFRNLTSRNSLTASCNVVEICILGDK